MVATYGTKFLMQYVYPIIPLASLNSFMLVYKGLTVTTSGCTLFFDSCWPIAIKFPISAIQTFLSSACFDLL